MTLKPSGIEGCKYIENKVLNKIKMTERFCRIRGSISALRPPAR